MSSERKQRKAVSSLTGVLPAGTAVRAYAAGRANARMTRPAAYLIAGFVALFVLVAVLTGRLLIPGVLVLVILVSWIRPLRGIAASDDGVYVVSTSAWSNRPRAVVNLVSNPSLLPPNVSWVGKTAVRIPFGSDVVRLRAKDYQRLLGAEEMTARPYTAPDASPQAPPFVPQPQTTSAAPPGWYPIQNNQFQQAYWNGSSWVAFKRWDGQAWLDTDMKFQQSTPK